MAFPHPQSHASGYRSDGYGYSPYYTSTPATPQVYEGYQPIPSSFGAANASAQQDAFRHSTDGSTFGNAPSAKRPRLDGGYDDGTPLQGRPSMDFITRDLVTPQLQSAERQTYAGPAQNIPNTLEQQVRGLARYDHGIAHPNASLVPASDLAASSANQPDIQFAPSGRVLPQRGAAPGNILNLSCVMCTKKKRKCTKDFPCTECRREGSECVPRRRRKPTLPNANADANDEEAEPADGDIAEGTAGNAQGHSTTLKGHQVDDPQRRFYSHLAPVIGNHQEWSNMRTKYRGIPDDLDAMREKLYHIREPMLLNSQQFADYWYFMSNILVRDIAPVTQTNGTVVEIWECRNCRRAAKMKGDEGTGKRKRETKRHLLETQEPCKFRFRTLYYIKHADTDEDHQFLGSCWCLPEWVHIQRTDRCEEHNHSLKSADQFKRADALTFFARQKVEEGGYMYASVRRWVHEKFNHLTQQTEFLTTSDIANASRSWRNKHRDLELVATIEEQTQEVDVRKQGLDLLPSATYDGVKRALTEVLLQIPQSINIILPILQSAQDPALQPSGGHGGPIQEGDAIKIPFPGLPPNMFQENGKVATLPPSALALPKNQKHNNFIDMSDQIRATATVAYQLPGQQQHTPAAAPTSGRKDVPAPYQTGTLRGNRTPSAPKPQIPSQLQVDPALSAESRPSWAMSGSATKTKATANDNSSGSLAEVLQKEEQEVRKQLEAELQGGS